MTTNRTPSPERVDSLSLTSWPNTPPHPAPRPIGNAQMTQWDAPWTQFTDPRSGSSFWYNMQTGISAWEKPTKKEEAAAALEAANNTESAWQCVLNPQGAVMYYWNWRTGESTYDVPEEVELENKRLEEEQAAAYAAWEAEAAAEQEAIQQQIAEYEKQVADAKNMNTEQKSAYDELVRQKAAHEAELEALAQADHDTKAEEEVERSKIAELQAAAADEITEMIASVEREKTKKQDALKERLAARKAALAAKAKAKKSAQQTVLHHGGIPAAPGAPSAGAPSAHQHHLMRHLRALATVVDTAGDGPWHKCKNTKTGDVFYWNHEKEVVHWEDPNQAAAVAAAGGGGGGDDGGGGGGKGDAAPSTV